MIRLCRVGRPVGIVSGAVIFIGYLWMLWDREKQTWFDKASNSVVVPVAAYPLGGGASSGY